jgi:hypothetical protein
MATDNTGRNTADRMDLPFVGLTMFSVPTRVPGLGTPSAVFLWRFLLCG